MRTTRGLERLITFVDAVVAIAVTLLVLPLVDIAKDPATRSHPGAFLRPDVGQIGVFLLSFVVIARLWTVHHSMFERVRAYDTALLWWTLAWALTIVFLPFPTELVPGTGHEIFVRELYVGTMTLSSICLSGLAVVIARRPALRVPGAGSYTSEGALISSLLFLVAMTLTPIRPIGYYSLLVLLLEGPLIRLWRRLRTSL